ncbi:energy transducer TonB [Pelagicoccus mobilis]|uniref:Energy transducer TonB n=1 Tax=Pelagicoccus mobilis TaxID=415221 RepID=A0A934RVW3_9BACT|nr:energy transducer TonB [Pelagicoccus mobilis]MBK1878695.1 energy transducer TonB [Pelagicoccus mobilis]
MKKQATALFVACTIGGLSLSASNDKPTEFATITFTNESSTLNKVVQNQPTYYEAGDNRYEIGILTDPHPKFPRSLRKKVEHGSVLLSLSINEEGKLEDWLPLYATDRAFIKEINKVVGQWAFYPPTDRGVPVPVIIDLEINFQLEETDERNNDPIYQTALSSFYAQNHAAQSYKRLPYRVYDLKELDQPVKVVHAVKPSIPKSLLKSKSGGQAAFEFYIDTNGHVRLLSLLKREGNIQDEALELMYQAIEHWVFEPPVKDGKQVTVKATQQIKFPAIRS